MGSFGHPRPANVMFLSMGALLFMHADTISLAILAPNRQALPHHRHGWQPRTMDGRGVLGGPAGLGLQFGGFCMTALTTSVCVGSFKPLHGSSQCFCHEKTGSPVDGRGLARGHRCLSHSERHLRGVGTLPWRTTPTALSGFVAVGMFAPWRPRTSWIPGYAWQHPWLVLARTRTGKRLRLQFWLCPAACEWNVDSLGSLVDFYAFIPGSIRGVDVLLLGKLSPAIATMEQQTSALLQRLSESATIAMARKARK